MDLKIGNDDVLRCEGRVCVPNDEKPKKGILDEGSRAEQPYPHLGLAGMVSCSGYGDFASTRA